MKKIIIMLTLSLFTNTIMFAQEKLDKETNLVFYNGFINAISTNQYYYTNVLTIFHQKYPNIEDTRELYDKMKYVKDDWEHQLLVYKNISDYLNRRYGPNEMFYKAFFKHNFLLYDNDLDIITDYILNKKYLPKNER